MIEHGTFAYAVSGALESDPWIWCRVYAEMRPAVLERAEQDGGTLAEGPPHRVEVDDGALYLWPAVRERVPEGGMEHATEGPAQQQAGACTEGRCSTGTQEGAWGLVPGLGTPTTPSTGPHS